ncbi:MoaD/ThiS family protein [Alienimonas sp. DA493]|uniref:MoaD/ThiS family protein n=1 Tax=Alienimonas sp. DA493 TaxID=3373605 RepID=UPI003754CEAA
MSSPPDSPLSAPARTGRTVEVRLFGPQARLAGADRVAVPAPQTATVADLRAALSAACEPLRPSLKNSRFAVDHEYVADDALIPSGAEVALIGLVSGG